MIENNPIPKNKRKKAALLLSLMLMTFSFSSCATNDSTTTASAKSEISDPVTVESVEEESVEEESVNQPWTDEDLNALALTLAGECYEDEIEDKRSVCEVVLNRVSDEDFDGDTVYQVVSSTKFGVQFEGYWHQSRNVTENDIEVAKSTLTDWYANGCKPFSDYRFFSAGDDNKNSFC